MFVVFHVFTVRHVLVATVAMLVNELHVYVGFTKVFHGFCHLQEDASRIKKSHCRSGNKTIVPTDQGSAVVLPCARPYWASTWHKATALQGKHK